MAGLSALLPFIQQIAPEAVGEDIGVMGRRVQMPAPDYAPDAGPIPLGNRSHVEEARDWEGKNPQRTGKFGIKGVLRDVLGALSDNYLMQNGQKPQYQAMRQQERISDAMAGFAQNPMAAMERLASIPGGTEAAYDLFKTVGSQQSDAAQQRAAAAKNAAEMYDKGVRIFGQMAGAANADTYGTAKDLLQEVRNRYGLGEKFIVPDEYDEKLMRTYQYGGMPAQQQVSDVRKVEAEAGRNKRAEASNETSIRRTSMQQEGADRRDNPPTPTRTQQAEDLWRRAKAGDKDAEALFNRLYPEPKRNRFKGAAVPSGVKSKGKSGWGKMSVK